MRRLSRRAAADRAATTLKIAMAVFFALVVAAACVALAILFIRADFLPGGVRATVLLLSLLCLYADFRLCRKYVDALLDEVDD